MRLSAFALSLLAAFASGCAPGGPIPAASPPPTPPLPPTSTAPAVDIDPAALDRLRQALALTLAAGTARTTVLATVSRPGREDARLVGDGAMDFRSRRSATVLDLSGALSSPSSTAHVVGDDRHLTVVIDDTVAYVRSPLLLGELPEAWLRIEGSAIPRAVPGGLEGFLGMPGTDSTGMLALLADIDAAAVRSLGVSRVGDTATTHFRATIELSPNPVPDRDAEPSVGDAPRGLLVPTTFGPVELDVHLDDEGRVRRLASSHRLPGIGGDIEQRVEVDLSDLGAPLDIDVPTPDQTTELAELAGG